jgi:Lipid A 3-O-deacylase (PagL)
LPATQKMTRRYLVLFSLMLGYFTQPALSKGQDTPPTTQPVTPQPSATQPATSLSTDRVPRRPKRPDFNRAIHYKNKWEFSLDYGYLPINIPWPFDVFLGDQYNMTPRKYTLEPNIASLRWQMGDVAGPGILRGNWDMTFSGSFTAIPRGPETRYWSYDMGIRRNFIRPNWRVVPYFDLRLGLGDINAKEPKGFAWAQGQNFTFTFNLGSGVRYNFNPRFAISGGINFMHISNLYLSEPRYTNYGINVYGPMVGFDVRLGKAKREASVEHPDMEMMAPEVF